MICLERQSTCMDSSLDEADLWPGKAQPRYYCQLKIDGSEVNNITWWQWTPDYEKKEI